jgi:hypothetical protein
MSTQSMTATDPGRNPDPPVTAEQVTALVGEVREMKDLLRRLEATVRGKVATPVNSLTTCEAAELLACSVASVRRLLERDLFTDVRAGKRSGSPWKLLADELECYRMGGEEELMRFRREMGRA